MDIIEQALNIAKDNLRLCYTYEGIWQGIIILMITGRVILSLQVLAAWQLKIMKLLKKILNCI